MEQNERHFEIWQPLLLAGVLAIGMIVGTMIDDQIPDAKSMIEVQTQTDWQDVVDVVKFIQSRYGDEVDVDSVAESTINHLMEHLDPHSYYLSGTEYTYFKERLTGGYRGIGIEYEAVNDTVYLTYIYNDGPADRAGLKQGDLVLRIDQTAISGQGLNAKEVLGIWKKTDAVFDLQLKSAKSGSVFSARLEKDRIDLKTVTVAKQLTEGLGYIKINHFANGTYTQFMEAIEHLQEKDVQDLVIDVRDNPGGSLQEVVKILNQLVVEPDQLLLYMDGKHVKRTEYKAEGRVYYKLGNIAVLINEHSVSASEVLAGVLQDLGRATVIGRRSFGKALVQEMYELGDGAAINLTIGKYFLPSGRYIQRSYSNRGAYKQEVERRLKSGELFTADSLKILAESLHESSDGVRRPVGEGVIPDIFVPGSSITLLSTLEGA